MKTNFMHGSPSYFDIKIKAIVFHLPSTHPEKYDTGGQWETWLSVLCHIITLLKLSNVLIVTWFVQIIGGS